MIALLWSCATEPTEPEPTLVPEPIVERVPEAVHEPAPAPPQGEPPAATKTFDEVVQGYEGQLLYCYDKVRKADPSVQGRLVMAWRLEGGSVVDLPRVVEDTTASPELIDCVTTKIRRWQFPTPISGEFSRPFTFRPK